ncbi:hypothetical protein AFK62_06720 [Cronobacter condimenti 1330]|uniref:Lipoprotein n=1 Tax=Cronobacter condimenti 1330 TaxID=1073999 RepID=A0ABN4I6R5_9ENTR|nr:hypothetical protein [Cronobacter condimenti]ALB62212.1 hypothetical protein AFK62_06720 [Cronobacter condimenti 1330]
MLKVLIGVVGILAGAFACAIPYIKMEFAGNAYYTEKDEREYRFFTPKILQEMPRISEKYEFSFINVSGPASHVHVIKFYGTADTRRVSEYLISKGYKKQVTCDIEAACWRGSDPQETLYVGTFKDEDIVMVQVVTDFT